MLLCSFLILCDGLQLFAYSRFVEESMNRWIDRVDNTFSSCSEGLTSLAEVFHEDWPQVTIPHFETIQSKALLDIPGFEHVYLAPQVNAEQLEAYLQYTNENYASWIAEAQSHRDVNGTSFAPVKYKNFVAVASGSEPKHGSPTYTQANQRSVYWPIWQHSPPPDDYSLVNVDLNGMDGLGMGIESALSSDFALSAIAPENEAGVGRLFYYFLRSVRRDVGNQGSPIVAMIVGKVDWVEVLGEILPLTEIPVNLVLHDSCGQADWTFSFVNGNLSSCNECNAPISSLESGFPIDWLGDLRSTMGVCSYDLVSKTVYCDAYVRTHRFTFRRSSWLQMVPFLYQQHTLPRFSRGHSAVSSSL